MSRSLLSILRDVAVYGAGDALLKASALITLPIYTRVFTPEAYGVWGFVVGTVGFLGALLALGADSAYARFFFEARDDEERSTVTSTALALVATWSVAVVALCLPFAGLMSHLSFDTREHAPLFALALAAIPLALVNDLCGQALRNQFRAPLFTALNFASAALTIGCGLVAVLVLGLGVEGLLGGALVASVVLLPVRLVAVRGLLRARFSRTVLLDLLAFGVPLVPTAVAMWVLASSGRVILGKTASLSELGLFSVASSVTSVLGLFNGALGQAWSPHAVHVYEERPDEAPAFYGRILTYILVGFGCLCVGITAFSREALAVLASPAYRDAAIAVGPLALSYVAQASMQVTAAGISLSKKTHYFALISGIGAAVHLVSNLLLVPRFGLLAAAWTTAGSYGVLTIAYLVVARRLWAVAYEVRRSVVTVVLTLGFTAAMPLVPALDPLPSLLVKSGITLSYATLLLLLGAIDGRELSAFSRWRRPPTEVPA